MSRLGMILGAAAFVREVLDRSKLLTDVDSQDTGFNSLRGLKLSHPERLAMRQRLSEVFTYHTLIDFSNEFCFQYNTLDNNNNNNNNYSGGNN